MYSSPSAVTLTLATQPGDVLQRGVVFLNGFPLGRYDARGPQRSVYAPQGVARAGRNALLVLETAAGTAPGPLELRTFDHPLYNH